MLQSITDFIRSLYGPNGPIALHEPIFLGAEKRYLAECIDTGYVSTVGSFVEKFEKQIAEYTGARFAVSTVNGTAALHAAMILAGVKPGDAVLTQALTFVATANSIAYCGAEPVFVDVNRETLGLSPLAARRFFENHCERTPNGLISRATRKKIAACVPVHVFGHPLDINGLNEVCAEFGVPVIEDAAEGMGSLLEGQHLGTFGLMGTLSFNGNKIMTTGGGGMILTNNEVLAKKAKHLTTTARLPSVEYVHDQVGYNYRMPNLNAALGCAQLEHLNEVLVNKIETAMLYKDFFASKGIPFISAPPKTRSNYWLNAILMPNKNSREEFLSYAVERKIFARPAWRPMNELAMFKSCETDPLAVTKELCDRIVNLPSSYRKPVA